MRISSQTLADQFLASLDKTQSAISTHEQQISTGQSFQVAGDNPTAATAAVTLQGSLSQISAYASNSTTVQSRLSIQDSALSSVTAILTNIRTLTVQASNSTLSNTDRAALATNIAQQLQSLTQLANTQDGTGQYLFAGTATGAPPFVQAANGTVSYQGNNGTRQIQIGSGRFVTDTDSGSAVFSNIPNGNGSFAVQPASSNTGFGVVGTTAVTNSAQYSGHSYKIDFQAPAVVPALGNAGNASLSAPVGAVAPTPAPGPTTINFLSPTTYTLSFGGTTSAVQTLAANGVISGNGFSVTLAGTPAATDSFTVAPGPTYSVTDTTTNTSVVPAGTAYSSGQSISIPNSGVQLEISGAPANGDSFAVAPSSNQSIFATLSNLVSALKTPATTATQTAALQNALNQNLGAIDQAVNNVSDIRTQVGTRLNAVTAQDTINSNVKLQLQRSLTAATSTDYAAAITSLSQEQVSLQAAEQSYASLKNLSIFNYL